MKGDDSKHQEEREKKIKRELDKLKIKHDNENNNFNLKLNQTYTEFKKKRALELEKLLQKFKIKVQDLENVHKNQISMLENPKKMNMNSIIKLYFFCRIRAI